LRIDERQLMLTLQWIDKILFFLFFFETKDEHKAEGWSGEHKTSFQTQVYTCTWRISNGRGNQTPKPKRQSLKLYRCMSYPQAMRFEGKKDTSCIACRHHLSDLYHLLSTILHLQSLLSAIVGSTSFIFDLWSRLLPVTQCLVSVEFLYVLITDIQLVSIRW